MTKARKTIHRISKQVYYLTVVVCFVFLLSLLAIVSLSNAVSERKDEAAQWLSQQVGYPVTIGELQLHLLNFFPKLHLRNVHILDTQKRVAVMSVNHIYLDIDLLASLEARQAVLNHMSLNEASVHIERDKDGEITVCGLEKLLGQQYQSSSDEFSLPVQAVDLTQLAINYVDMNRPVLSGAYQLDDASFNLHDRNQLLVRASALLPIHLGQRLAFNGVFELKSDGFKLEKWHAQINANNLSVTSWSSLVDLDDVELTRGVAKANINIQAKDAESFEASANVELVDVAVKSKQNEKQDDLVINQLKTRFEADGNLSHWALKTDFLLLDVDQQQWPETKLKLVADADDYQLKMDYLNIANLTNVAGKLVSIEQLETLQASGEVEDLELAASTKTGLKSLSAKVKQLAINQTENIPGVSGLTAELSWTDQAGFVLFDSENLVIDAQDKLPKPVNIKKLTGKATLQKAGQQWLLESSDLYIKNDDFTFTVNGSVTHSEQATVPNLHIDLENIQVANWKNYIPLDILSDDFREWSEHAFIAGNITKGSLDLSGDLAEFPFLKPEQNGEFKMELAATGMQLDYGVDWPHLYDVDASIIGDGKRLTIKSQHGRIADFAFNKLRTDIDNYLVSKPVLMTKGQVDGTSQKALDFLKNSPLKDRFGQIAASFTATGTTSIILDLTVPLTNVNSATASGSISFNNSQLISDEDIDIQLDKVNGLLLFDGEGVKGNKLAAKFLDQAINIDVLPAKGSTLIEVTGDMPVTKLYEKWPDLKADFISGNAAFKTTVSVTEQQRGLFELDVNIASGLEGVTIDMPAPFGKTATQQRQLVVQIHEHKKDILAYRVNYADLFSTYLLADNDLIKGEIRVGASKAKLAESGLSLKGKLDQLDLVTWQNWQKNQPSQQEASFLDSLDLVSLNIDQLNAANQSVTNLALVAEKAAQDWRINVHADQVKGRVNWPYIEQADLPVVIDLDYLYLTTAQTESDKIETASSSLWPSIQFHTKQLHVNKMKLGELSFSSRKLATKWLVDSFVIDANSYRAEGSGAWQHTASVNNTNFTLKANSNDLKALLADFGYQQAIEAKDTELDVDLNWAGSPTDLSLANLNGSCNLKLGAGTLVDVEPGAAGRIFGLMSITAIPRRLTLDFSDLFSKGFNFSSISGQFKLADGIADTSDLVMAGDAAKIEIKGPIDLVKKSYNQSIKVTPKVSSTLPFAGAVAGGPVGLGVGTAILLVDKIADNLFGKEIVNLVSYNYKLSGPWTEPELTTLQAVTE